MLRFSDGEHYVELEVTPEMEADGPGSAYASIRVSARGFRGYNDKMIPAENLRDFCRALVLVEATREGSATLSMTDLPGELKLTVIYYEGHEKPCLNVQTGQVVILEKSPFWYAVAVGFPLDAAQLAAAVELPWVVQYAD